MSAQTRGPWSDHSVVLTTAASTLLIAADTARQGLVISNANGSAQVAITINATASFSSAGSIILSSAGTPGATFRMIDNAIATNAWNVISTAGAATAGSAITAWTFP